MSENLETRYTLRAERGLSQISDYLVSEQYAMNDEGRANASAALHDALESDSYLKEATDTLIAVRWNSETPELVNVLHSSLIYFAALDGRELPMTLEDNRSAIDRLEGIMFDEENESITDEDSELLAKFRNAFFFRNLNTNVAGRYGPAELVMQLYASRWQDGVHFLDYGCSIKQGPNALALKNDFLRRGIRVFPPVSVVDHTSNLLLDETAAYAKLMDRESVLVDGTGIDLIDPNDPDTLLWALSNLRHRERNSARSMAVYKELESSQPANIRSIRADFTNPIDMARVRQEVSPVKPNLKLFNTVLYQLEPHELQRTLEMIPDDSEEKVIAIAQDTFESTEPGITLTELKPDPSNWKHWTTMLYDTSHPEAGWQPILHSESSRFETVRLGAGKIAVNGIFKTLSETLREIR